MTDQEPQGTPRWGDPPPATPPSSRAEEPVRPPWLGPPPAPPPLFGPPPPPPAARGSSASWWRAALIGGLVGAVVAATVSAAVVLAADDDEPREPVAAPAVAGSNLELRGEPLDVQGVLQAVQEGVVSIRTEVRQSGFFGTQTGQSAGSGMIIDDSGLVLTNAHVVQGASSITVNLRNGASLDGELLGAIRASDIALVQIDPGELQLTPVRLGSSDALRVGDDVVAVGNALNLGEAPTVTTGIVSATDRSVPARDGITLRDLVQTDAAINPGNSGGPLVDASGAVIGVNTAIAQGAENIGFAIGIDAVRPLIEDIRVGSVPFLGVATLDLDGIDDDVRENLGADREGALVSEVEPGSGAEAAGLRPRDLIIEIGGEPVTNSADVRAAVSAAEPGDTIEIRYVRDGEERTASATLGSRPVEDD
jgi:S1-C subfamily serine protease